jgi:long-chain acyl-CoA synthetase
VSQATAPSCEAVSESRAGIRTIPALWRDAIAWAHPEPAYLVEHDGSWTGVTWAEADSRVRDLANGLLALGVRKGDAFGILASTRVEWALFDFALAHVGGVTAPVYATASARDCAYILEHSESIGVLVENEEQRRKVEQVREGLPRLAHLIAFDDLDALAERGRQFAAANPGALDEAVAAIGEEDLYTFIYTSGTTGPPKGCMIRHRNFYEMAACLDGLGDIVRRGDTLLLFLPLAHNFGRLLHLAGPYGGYTLAFCPDPYRIATALAAVRPTVFPSVPRVYENVYAAVTAAFAARRGLGKLIVEWALRVGRSASARRQAQQPLPVWLVLQHRVCDRLVYSKVKRRLGGRLRTPLSGSAPLAVEVAEFFHALDILILEGYGLTECTTAATVNRPARFRFGTVGLPLPGFELRTAEDGEILIRSETVFAGYYKDDEATRAVLGEDGWLRTGDLGEIDADGFLRITGRKKDIIVTSGGKNISPQNIENDLRSSRYVSQALVVGDRRPHCVALVTLDPDEIGRWAAAQGLEGDIASLAAHPDVRALIQAVVDAANEQRSAFERIRRFAILPRDFSMAEGEVTPTLKLRRQTIEERYADEIGQLYTGPQGSPT